MADIVASLQQGITADTIFSVVGQVIPFVITMVPIALGLTMLRRVVKGAGSAKIRF